MASEIAVIIPAFNEEPTIGELLDEVRQHCPDLDVVVVSDGSTDGTAAAAAARGARVLRLPHNLGIGGCVQAGFLYCFRAGYRFAVRIDGDGQHPPSEIPKLIRAMGPDEDMVVGSRFLGGGGYTSTLVRHLGIRCLAAAMSLICRQRITDPTSGFCLVNRKLMYCFAHRYPADYPEPEALALLRRQGYRSREVAVQFRPRLRGRSSITGWGTFYYLIKVGLALLVDRARPVDRRYARWNLADLA